MNGAWRLPKGSYTYEASLFGYETASGSLTVTGENDSLSVTLQQAARHSVRFATVKAEDGSTLSVDAADDVQARLPFVDVRLLGRGLQRPA